MNDFSVLTKSVPHSLGRQDEQLEVNPTPRPLPSNCSNPLPRAPLCRYPPALLGLFLHLSGQKTRSASQVSPP